MTVEDLICGVDATDEIANLLAAIVWFDGSCGPRNPGGTAKGGWVIETNDGRRIEGMTSRPIKVRVAMTILS